MMIHERQSNRHLHIQYRNRVITGGTEAFLDWALVQKDLRLNVPVVPGELGGYTELLKRPGARQAASHYWHRVLS